MFIDVSDPISAFIEVLDLHTGKFIRGVQFASQETGIYTYIKCIEKEDGDSEFDVCPTCGELKKHFGRSNIVLVYKGEKDE